MIGWLTKFIGIGKNPFTSWTMWGLAIWKASSVIAETVCGVDSVLPAEWCLYAKAGIEGFGQVLTVVGVRRAIKK